MATFNLNLDHKATKNRKYNIYVVVNIDGKRKYIKTSYQVSRISDWNPSPKGDNWIKTSEPNSKVWNAGLAKELESVKEKYRELKDDGLATSEKVKRAVAASEKTASFLDYAKKRTQEVYNAGGIRNWKKYNGFVNKLEAFQEDRTGKVRDLAFGEITPAYIARFDAYLHTLHNERQPDEMLHPNTIEVVMKVFRTLIRRAIEVDGLMKPDKYPFLNYKFCGVKTQKDKLDMDEIEAIKALQLEEGSLLWHCRNYFLFSFYCAGIRAGDLIQLRWCNISAEGRINYQMGKNHKERDLILVPQAREILQYYHNENVKAEDYIFPLLDSRAEWAKAITQADKDKMPADLKKALFNTIGAKNALINKYLNKIAQLTGIQKKVSFHISRHSFAKVAKQKGVDNSKVKDMLAHSSLKVTETYMGSFDTKETDATLVQIFEENEPQPATTDTAALLAQLQSLKPEELAVLLAKLGK